MVSQGDIVIVEFQPSCGHDLRENRPGVVVSNDVFHQKTNGLAILVPITTTARPGFPLHVDLDQRTKTKGQVLCEQLKTMDTAVRSIRFVEKIPPDILDKIIKIIKLEL